MNIKVNSYSCDSEIEIKLKGITEEVKRPSGNVNIKVYSYSCDAEIGIKLKGITAGVKDLQVM